MFSLICRRVCMCVSVCTVHVLTFESLHLETSCLVWGYIFSVSTSSSYVKVIGSRSRSQEQITGCTSITKLHIRGWSDFDSKASFLHPPPLRNGAGGILYSGLSVCEGVSLCVPKTLSTPHLKNQWREIHPIVVTDEVDFVNVLVRSCV